MKKNLHFVLIILLIASSSCFVASAQEQDALQTKEFRLEEKKITTPAGTELITWQLCLNGYRVLISGQKQYIPIYPVYTECCFKTIRDRAIDALERASNALDSLLHGETLRVIPAPQNGNFQGSGIWTIPTDMDKEHSGLVFRIDNSDVSHFGFRAQDAEDVAVYVKDVFDIMRTLFLERTDPSDSPAMDYPHAKILKRVWLDARQHAQMIRNISPDESAESVTQEDLQEAIDMLSESQRLRLLGIALLIPVKE